MILDLRVVGAFFKELCGRCGMVDDVRCVDGRRMCVGVGLEGTNALPPLLVVHPPHPQVTVITRACQHRSRHVPCDAPHGAVVIVELSGGNDFEAVVAGLVDDGLKVEDAAVLGRDGQHVIAATGVGSERQVVDGVGDARDGFRLRPLPVVLAVLEDEDFRLVGGVVAAGGNHRRV